MLKYKSDAFNACKNFKVLAEVEKKEKKIKSFQIFLGGAFSYEGFKYVVISRG